MNPWFLVILAGLLEVGWALGLKSTQGFTRLWPSLFVVAMLVASLWLLALAVRQLPIGTAYAVWVGIGAAGAALAAVFFHGEILTPARAFFLVLLIVAVIGLKASATSH
jgi:quaternary ammonium compound-resistance protein SugE